MATIADPPPSNQRVVQELLDIERQSGLPVALGRLHAQQLQVGFVTALQGNADIELSDGLRIPLFASREIRDNAYGLNWRVYLNSLRHGRPVGRLIGVEGGQLINDSCILCPENNAIKYPKEIFYPYYQRETTGGSHKLAFWVTCNPFPLEELHLTLVSPRHEPLEMSRERAGMIRHLLEFCGQVPDISVACNGGAEVGGSVATHFHGQALRTSYPVEEATITQTIQMKRSSSQVSRLHYPYTVLLVEGDDPATLSDDIYKIVSQWRQATGGNYNMIARATEQGFKIYLFLRDPNKLRSVCKPEVKNNMAYGYFELGGLQIMVNNAGGNEDTIRDLYQVWQRYTADAMQQYLLSTAPDQKSFNSFFDEL